MFKIFLGQSAEYAERKTREEEQKRTRERKRKREREKRDKREARAESAQLEEELGGVLLCFFPLCLSLFFRFVGRLDLFGLQVERGLC